MCGIEGSAYDYQPASPEQTLSEALRRELGVHIDPQALRIFIRTHWRTVSVAAHRIHDAT